MSRNREAIKTFWTSELRQFAAGYYASNQRLALECPSVPLELQRKTAAHFGLGEAALSCKSCEGRGLLCVISQIHSKGGRVAGSFRHVMRCPVCNGQGLDSNAYALAQAGREHFAGAMH